MANNIRFGFLGLLTALILTVCCKPTAPDGTPIASGSGYFQTPFQSESQFIVGAIVSDLAEELYYAKNHRLPEKKYFSVVATEQGGPVDAPVYDFQISLDKQHTAIKLKLNVNGVIWSPDVYGEMAASLAQAIALTSPETKPTGDTELVAELVKGTAEVMEQENQRVSAALEKDFTSPELHEQAALLLGAFMLREHSGQFFEIRSPLSRLTAHLTMARFLAGSEAYGVNGRLAEATMLALVNDRTFALQALKAIDSHDNAVMGMVRTLQILSTGNFLLSADEAARSPVESVARFFMMADYVDLGQAWNKLNDNQKQTIDFVRVANEEGYSVEIGHELLQTAVPLELKEIQEVFALSKHKKLAKSGLTAALNEMPEYCFNRDRAQTGQVRIIGWGQWAMFFQRHLCHAVRENFHFMNVMWGVRDDAKAFAAECEKDFGGLRLYPFVRRYNCSDEAAYHKAVDDSFKVTVATPHLVSAQCWNYICYRVPFAPLYDPNPNPHINEWHSHNPPPGTVYDLGPRLNHPSLVSRPDAIARFEQLQKMAPSDIRIISFIAERKYTNHLTYEQAMSFLRPLLPYSAYALRWVANTAYDQPEQYEKLMLQAAEINPTSYYDLSHYAEHRKDMDKAAEYMDKACDADPDSIRVANRATWRVRYALSKGQVEKARKIADFAGEVYSQAGLVAKAMFLESTSNYPGAFEWFAKIEERYDDPNELIKFCQRYKSITGDTRFDAELKKRLKVIFPKGMEKVSMKDFRAAPTDGTVYTDENEVLLAAGMNKGDVIVALNGVRARTTTQYLYLRDSLTTPEMNLIVWQGSAFREIKSSPPNHRFGVNLDDYKPK